MHNCPLCQDTGWVCETCGTRWELENGDTCCGAGKNCVCNPEGEVDWVAVDASTNPEDVKVWRH